MNYLLKKTLQHARNKIVQSSGKFWCHLGQMYLNSLRESWFKIDSLPLAFAILRNKNLWKSILWQAILPHFLRNTTEHKGSSNTTVSNNGILLHFNIRRVKKNQLQKTKPNDVVFDKNLCGLIKCTKSYACTLIFSIWTILSDKLNKNKNAGGKKMPKKMFLPAGGTLRYSPSTGTWRKPSEKQWEENVLGLDSNPTSSLWRPARCF